MTDEPQTQVSLRDDPLFGIELGPKMQACDPRERIFAFAVGVMGMSNAEAARRPVILTLARTAIRRTRMGIGYRIASA